MKMELVVALTSGAVAIIVAGVSLMGTLKVSKRTNELERFKIEQQQRYDSEREQARYKEPLLHAAYDLQSRLYNILKQNLVAVYLTKGAPREKAYVVENTTFVIAQYFSWTEITRDEIQFIDLGKDSETSKLSQLLDEINHLWLTDEFPKPFRIFAGEQRAIGEAMEQKTSKAIVCVGYGAFLAKVLPSQNKLIDAVREDVKELPNKLEEARPRLVALQHALIDLLDYLDPRFVRFPKHHRTKI
jgi:hypothetical protein